jgi:small redox-active disulfide protein 2
MKIQVLGSGCSTCKQLLETTKRVIEDLKIETEVEYITDVTKMIEMGVMTSPVLAIDGKPVLTGGNKSEEEVRKALCGEIKITEDKNKSGGCSCGGNC